MQMYCDVLDTLEHGPLKGVCSPSLIGSSGVVPMTTISLCVWIFTSKDLIILSHYAAQDT